MEEIEKGEQMYDLEIEGSRILIVDDTPKSLGLLEKMLTDKGYHVFAMTNGDAALKTVAQSRPELILLDVRMPGMDGYEVCRRLRERPEMKDISIIFLSSLNETGDIVKGFEAGGVDYITKPFQFGEVEARVKTHLLMRKMRMELERHNAGLEALVAERTRDLDLACKRLRLLEQIKGDFLTMISHEMRTPLNGLLGAGEMMFRERHEKIANTDELEKIYCSSRKRIEQLLDDASTINSLDYSGRKTPDENGVRLDELFSGHEVPAVMESAPGCPVAAGPKISGDLRLLRKAISTILHTARCFSRSQGSFGVRYGIDGDAVTISISLDDMKISEEFVGSFFELASLARQSSPAEPLGIAPVVARKIFVLFGGDVRLMKHEDRGGRFIITLRMA